MKVSLWEEEVHMIKILMSYKDRIKISEEGWDKLRQSCLSSMLILKTWITDSRLKMNNWWVLMQNTEILQMNFNQQEGSSRIMRLVYQIVLKDKYQENTIITSQLFKIWIEIMKSQEEDLLILKIDSNSSVWSMKD